MPLHPLAHDALLEQRELFREKFGRDWRDGDPIFFDPDCDTPTPLSQTKVQAEILEAMRKADLPPEVAYAYKKTGLLGLDTSNWPAAERREWDDAIAEYHAVDKAKEGKPIGWKTEIPELLVSPFGESDLQQVKDCLRAIAPIEERGMKVVTRIELAALFMLSACDLAFDSAGTSGTPASGPELFSMTEELIVRRARELYALGEN